MKMLKPALAAIGLLAGASLAQPVGAQRVRSTEDFLNTLGVNTHLSGLTRDDPWNTDIKEIGAQLNYIGIRLVRDWPYKADYGKKLAALRDAWRPDGKFWLSVVEGGPDEQRGSVAACAEIARTYPGMIYAVGGGNEEDNDYAQKLGATLPDTAVVQALLYTAVHPLGIVVSQSEPGSGWTAANNWNGDYDPNNTGIHQNYKPGPADVGGAHTYLIDPHRTMGETVAALRAKARLCTPGKPVAHTELGAEWDKYKVSPAVFGQSLVMGAFDSFAAGDVAYIMYGLQDTAPERTFGFYTFPGGKAHPAADYYHTMTTVLRSSKGGYARGAKPTFKPKDLNVAFSAAAAGHLVMQKPTGEYVIADWSEQPAADATRNDTDVIDFGRKFASVTVYDVEKGVTPIDTVRNASKYTLKMEPNDTYLIVLK